MSRRPTLDQLRRRLLLSLDGEWRTATYFQHRHGLGGSDWYRLCLALERLVADGHAELERPGAKVRRFRRKRRPA